MKKTLIIASTNLHLFNSIIIASSKQEECHLLFIDRNSSNDIYFSSLEKWSNNPFKSTRILVTDKSSIISKIKSKRESINEIYKSYKEINPSNLIIGNDRKNENAAIIEKIKDKISIEYMDDGLHSYILEKSSIFKYTFLDSLFKSLVYGNFIKTPKYIASSNYIKKIYLYKPELRNNSLKNKECSKLDISKLQTKEFKEYVKLLIKASNLNLEEELENIKHIVFLPHPKELDKNKINLILNKFSKNVAIKLHPRDKENEKYLKEKDIKILDKSIAAEILILYIQNIKIYGFNSTTLLMTKWLREEVKTHSLMFNEKPTMLEKFMNKNSIELVNINNIKL